MTIATMLTIMPFILSKNGAELPQSGNDVGDQLVFQPNNLITQAQLALLESGELELIGNRGLAQRGDGVIKVAVLDTHQFQSLLNLVVSHASDLAMPTDRSQRATLGRFAVIQCTTIL